jgi:hypothetical protein
MKRIVAMALVAALGVCSAAVQEGHATPTKRLTGDAVLAIDAKGRFVVGVDLAADSWPASPGRGPDGQVDEVFLLFGAQADTAIPFLRRSPRAVTIEVGERDVVVQLRGEKSRLRLTTQPTATGRRAGAEAETVLTGIELVRRTWVPALSNDLFEEDRNMSSFSTEAIPSIADEVQRRNGPAGALGSGDAIQGSPTRGERLAASAPSIQSCDTGGGHARSCSAGCNLLFGRIRWGCSVTCGGGYYACCSCSGGCKCVMDHDELWPTVSDPQ